MGSWIMRYRQTIQVIWPRLTEMINRIAQSNRKWEYAFVGYLSVLAILLTALANSTQVFLSSDSITHYVQAIYGLFNGV